MLSGEWTFNLDYVRSSLLQTFSGFIVCFSSHYRFVGLVVKGVEDPGFYSRLRRAESFFFRVESY